LRFLPGSGSTKPMWIRNTAVKVDFLVAGQLIISVGILKGHSHQIAFAWKWYGSIGNIRNVALEKNYTLPVIFIGPLKLFCNPH
jgi:hypothetical protein